MSASAAAAVVGYRLIVALRHRPPKYATHSPLGHLPNESRAAPFWRRLVATALQLGGAERGPSAHTAAAMSSRPCRPVCIVVDDFLDDPDAVRRVALAQRFVKQHCAGLRTRESFLHLARYREAFERLLGCELTSFDANPANGCFQLCTAADAIPHHSDGQSYAGVLFLTPHAPLDAGLSFFRSRRSGLRGPCADPELMAQTFG